MFGVQENAKSFFATVIHGVINDLKTRIISRDTDEVGVCFFNTVSSLPLTNKYCSRVQQQTSLLNCTAEIIEERFCIVHGFHWKDSKSLSWHCCRHFVWAMLLTLILYFDTNPRGGKKTYKNQKVFMYSVSWDKRRHSWLENSIASLVCNCLLVFWLNCFQRYSLWDTVKFIQIHCHVCLRKPLPLMFYPSEPRLE